MRLPRFEYYEPGTIKEGCALLSQPGTKLLAGGTELLVSLKQRTVTPKALVNIKRIPRLNYIEHKEDKGLDLGPLAILSAVAASPIVRERFSILAQAAASVGKPQIPNLATLGGNLCLDNRCFYFNQSYLW
jgi:4-hydroxybenzoyl-CoA reductase subunit beta